jgi:hypothetical protein
MWKGKYQSRDNTNITKERGKTLIEKMKRSLDERHT